MSERPSREQLDADLEALQSGYIADYKVGYSPTHRVKLNSGSVVYGWETADGENAEFHTIILTAMVNGMKITISHTGPIDAGAAGVYQRVQNITLHGA